MSTTDPQNPLIDALRERERQLELEAATVSARLEEIKDLLAAAAGPRRSRPRRQPPPELGPAGSLQPPGDAEGNDVVPE